MRIAKIYSRYYDKGLNHYIVIAQVRKGTDFSYRTMVFNSEEEMNSVKVGDELDGD